MIPLQKLVELDASSRAQGSLALALVLGDSYLYENNSIYRNIRVKAVAYGFAFNGAITDLWQSYQAFPLVSLQRMLDQRTIPVFDNVSIIRDLIKRVPDIAMSPHLLLTSLKKNYLLHEAAHAVAASAITSMKLGDLSEQSPQRQFVLRALLCEAFANTSEKLATIATARGASALFFAMNSYIRLESTEINGLKCAIRQIGIRDTFLLVYILFFISNIIDPVISDGEYCSIVNALLAAGYSNGESAKLRESLAVLHEARCYVNPDFRKETTNSYFDLLGSRAIYDEIGAIDWFGDGSALSVALDAAQSFEQELHDALVSIDA